MKTELELLLAIALDHKTCSTEKARIEGGDLVIPFDYYHPGHDPEWTIGYERVRDRKQLLDALGYGSPLFD